MSQAIMVMSCEGLRARIEAAVPETMAATSIH